MDKKKEIKLQSCLCKETPVIIEENGTWTYRHDCKVLRQRFEGTKFESADKAIQAWNNLKTKVELPKEGEARITDPWQFAHIQMAEAKGLQYLAESLKNKGKIQQGENILILASFKVARYDFWLGLYIEKCYREGKNPNEIFKPPDLPAGTNGKQDEQKKK